VSIDRRMVSGAPAPGGCSGIHVWILPPKEPDQTVRATPQRAKGPYRRLRSALDAEEAPRMGRGGRPRWGRSRYR
jgi:hypothetical protein